MTTDTLPPPPAFAAATDARPRPAAPRVRVQSFGCRLNAVEGDAVSALAEAAHADADQELVVINTCAVTSEAVRQARQAVRRARRDNPGARVVVTGCAAQTDPDAFAAMDEADAVLGNAEKLRPEVWRALAAPEGDAPRVQVADILDPAQTAQELSRPAAHAPGDQTGHRARAFLNVQSGCDHRCTFCIIPYGRGPARSLPAGLAVTRAQELVAAGHSEIVLTGVDITSWGQDLPGRPPLGTLVRRILRGAPELYRLRLSSLDAVEIDAELFTLLTENARIAPYLHLSLQAGSDMILKRMKRRHLRADAVDLCARLRAARPDIAFGADLIAGFPTETEAMFDETLALIDECDLAFVHAFPFSPREGTPAARMPQLPRAVVKDRAARLRAHADAALARHMSRHVGRTAEVLIERESDGVHQGRLADFTPVRLQAGAARPGALVQARLQNHDGRTLHAQAQAQAQGTA